MTVTRFCAQYKQPRGGLLNKSEFIIKENVVNLNEQMFDYKLETIHPMLMGTTVDLLVRYMITKDAKYVYELSKMGAGYAGEMKKWHIFIDDIKPDLSKKSIYYGIGLARYEQIFRSRVIGDEYWSVLLNDETINNIRVMVKRALLFLNNIEEGLVQTNILFHKGYTDVITQGDADYISKNSLIDLKVSSQNLLNKNHTLQLLIYYLLGINSDQELETYKNMKNIKYLTIYNPRLDKSWSIEIDKIKPEIINEVKSAINIK